MGVVNAQTSVYFAIFCQVQNLTFWSTLEACKGKCTKNVNLKKIRLYLGDDLIKQTNYEISEVHLYYLVVA